jgi:putative transposase
MRFVRRKFGIRWLGYVVMPEHVHLLLLPERPAAEDPVPTSRILHDLKGFSGRWGKRALREVWARSRSLGAAPLDAWATRKGDKPFWKTRAYDFNVVHEAKVREKLDYMHENPIRRGLVDRPEQWPWSSYRYYELADKSLIAMDWDGGFPL